MSIMKTKTSENASVNANSDNAEAQARANAKLWAEFTEVYCPYGLELSVCRDEDVVGIKRTGKPGPDGEKPHAMPTALKEGARLSRVPLEVLSLEVREAEVKDGKGKAAGFTLRFRGMMHGTAINGYMLVNATRTGLAAELDAAGAVTEAGNDALENGDASVDE